MDIKALLDGLAAQIALLQAQLVDTQAAADSIAKENYDKGFADGVASVPVGGGSFTQADIDAAVAAAVQPLNDQVAAMQATIDTIPDQIHAAVLAEDADLAAKIKPLIDQLNAALPA